MKWNKTGGHIFLCCFGSFPRIEERLKRFIENADYVQSALFNSLGLRARSVETRVKNMINLVSCFIFRSGAKPDR